MSIKVLLEKWRLLGPSRYSVPVCNPKDHCRVPQRTPVGPVRSHWNPAHNIVLSSFTIHFNVILSQLQLRLYIMSSLETFRLMIVLAFTISLMCATCPSHLILHDGVSLIMQGARTKAERALQLSDRWRRPLYGTRFHAKKDLVFDEEWKLWSSLFCNFLHPPINFFPLGPNLFFSIFFSNTNIK
jgi:hypothetical protein